jgi:protoporphyrinogen oxidase
MPKVVIIGAGPAGLAAGDKLCSQGVETIILEKDAQVGGLSRTIRHQGNFFDIGGHRFYTNNKAVLSWWQNVLKKDLLKVSRQSRIYYQETFFDYPLSISNILSNLGALNALAVAASYLKSRFFPHGREDNLEQWMINRFGQRLYEIFFKEYTQKVWGLSCAELSADWAGKRIKGLSLFVAVRNAIFSGRGNKVKTLIKEFYFPRFGSGMMYTEAAKNITAQGGKLHLYSEAVRINHDQNKITSVACKDSRTGKIFDLDGSDFCSSMPLTHLVSRMNPLPGKDILEMCGKLNYRSLVMVYFIVRRKDLAPDNWIYIHSSSVLVARIQNFGRWSPEMVADQNTSSLGMEYFCDEGDSFWSRTDKSILEVAAQELEKLGLCRQEEIIDGFVSREAKAYPVYSLDYRGALEVLKKFVSGFSNLQCIGRYGMFQYNNMDNSAFSGFLAAENILGAKRDLWSIDLEKECDD